MPVHYQASFFPAQAVALPGYHYRRNGRFCALPSRSALGGTARLSWRVRGHWCPPQRFLVADVCGTAGRVDFPVGQFRRLFGAAGVRQGLIPIRLLSVSGRVRHTKRHQR